MARDGLTSLIGYEIAFDLNFESEEVNFLIIKY